MELTDSLLDRIDISEEEIKDVVVNLDPNKASGPDLISNKMLKQVAGAIAKPLQIIFNRSLRESVFPDIWKLGNLVPLFKKGDKSLAANYRPVSLLSNIGKIQERIVFKHNIITYLVIIFYSNINLVSDRVILPSFNLLTFFTIFVNHMMKNNTLAWFSVIFRRRLIKFGIKGFYLNFDKVGSRVISWRGFLIICLHVNKGFKLIHLLPHYSLSMLVFPRGLSWGHFFS